MYLFVPVIIIIIFSIVMTFFQLYRVNSIVYSMKLWRMKGGAGGELGQGCCMVLHCCNCGCMRLQHCCVMTSPGLQTSILGYMTEVETTIKAAWLYAASWHHVFVWIWNLQCRCTMYDYLHGLWRNIIWCENFNINPLCVLCTEIYSQIIMVFSACVK